MDSTGDADNYIGQAMKEVASVLSLAAGRNISFAMTVEKLQREIQIDEEYKYLRNMVAENVPLVFADELAKYNYHRSNLSVSVSGLILYKGTRFVVPKTLRAGLLKALHVGHPGSLSMMLRAKDSFWWPGLSGDIEQVRALCQICHQNAPSQAKEPSFGVPLTNYAYESMCCDHFFLKGNEFLALVDRHSGMMSCHNTNYSGAKGFLKILREHCQRFGVPLEICTDGASVFTCQQTQDFFRRYNIHHRVSSVGNPHSNNCGELCVKSLKRILREYVSGTGCIDNDSVTQALLAYANTPCKTLGKSPSQIAYGRKLKDFFPRSAKSLRPVPQDLLGAEEKELKQLRI